jgi:molybdenum cofactor guanylyltransferase
VKPSAEHVSAIVLAGGRSVRFGRDKLAEPVDGRALLLHAVDAVRPLAGEIIVVAAPNASPAVPADVLVVHDETPYEGPLAGLVAGLEATRAPIALVVGGDSPTLVEAVLESMVATLDDRRIDVVGLEHEGAIRPLPMAIRRDAGARAARDLIERGERRLRSVFEVLSIKSIPEVTWRTLDPNGATLRDVDTPADLPDRSTYPAQ